MPKIKGVGSLSDAVYGKMQAALTAAGVPEPQGQWVAAIVRASVDDGYKAVLEAGKLPNQPPGVVAVFRQFDNRYPGSPDDAPATPPQMLQQLMPQGPKPQQPKAVPNMLSGLMGSPNMAASGSNPLASLFSGRQI